LNGARTASDCGMVGFVARRLGARSGPNSPAIFQSKPLVFMDIVGYKFQVLCFQ
jgi:hypothetical protein